MTQISQAYDQTPMSSAAFGEPSAINFATIKAEAKKLLESDDYQSPIKPLAAFRLSEVEAKPINWLWEPFLPLGTFSLMEGEEGIGKTFAVCAIATAVAHGGGLPNVPEGEHIPPSNVLLISAEDSLAHVLKPRLESMNAPCERIIAVEEPFTLDKDGILRLSLTIAEFAPKLVVIDPLFSYAGKINLNNDNEIRSVTDELKRLAEKYDCAIVGIRHIGKSKGMGDARNAGLNGVGWRASARSMLLIGKNPENERQKAICHTKSNYAPKFSGSLGFEIRDGLFFWTGESSLTAEMMLSVIRSENGDERSEKQDAVAFLREVLRDGERPAKDVQIEARQIGISDATLRRAKSSLNVQSHKELLPNGRWFWRLEDAQNDGEDVQPKGNEHLRLIRSNETAYGNKTSEGVQDAMYEQVHGKSEHLHGKTAKSKQFCPTCDREFSELGNGDLYCEICLSTKSVGREN